MEVQSVKRENSQDVYNTIEKLESALKLRDPWLDRTDRISTNPFFIEIVFYLTFQLIKQMTLFLKALKPIKIKVA